MTFPDFPSPELPRPVPPIQGEESPVEDEGENESMFVLGLKPLEACDEGEGGSKEADISRVSWALSWALSSAGESASSTVWWKDVTAGLRGNVVVRVCLDFVGE